MSYIAVLEDDPRRISAIRTAAQKYFSDYVLRLFTSSSEMIEWLQEETHRIKLISIDCDLDSSMLDNDQCGSGEDVAKFLAENPCQYPVMIHSSNAMRAPAMHMELSMADILLVKLCPFRDSNTWAQDVQALLGRG